MTSTAHKTSVIVFAILIFTSIITVGCKARQDDDLVNTKQLPGKKFSKYLPTENKKNTSRVVYLGTDENSRSSSSFGPRDVNFDFYTLKN